ncbi:winged helix-turn-helix transcriptional regulator [Chitinophaga flava]|uniref:Transcriptional regulator n=1 Tax=Chitinophaga flava TaxID=2259036 RepID=A0A365XZ75_9BACT|nr:helix-turn-helix domain-containing protein [Chitinophaga flava]RBL91686.1 transcriptional regulator [Chitinophaga flava]
MPEFKHDGRLYYNPIEFALSHIGGTWKMPILWRLRNRTLRYSELKKDIPHITHKMLTTQLKDLEASGLIYREVFAEAPPKVEYSITEKGKNALPVIEMLIRYGKDLMSEYGVDHPEEQ